MGPLPRPSKESSSRGSAEEGGQRSSLTASYKSVSHGGARRRSNIDSYAGIFHDNKMVQSLLSSSHQGTTSAASPAHVGVVLSPASLSSSDTLQADGEEQHGEKV